MTRSVSRLHDRAVLGHRHEFLRIHQPVGRMAPPKQRLDTVHRAGAEADLGLVVHWKSRHNRWLRAPWRKSVSNRSRLRAVRVVARLVGTPLWRRRAASRRTWRHSACRMRVEKSGCVLVAERDANRCRDVHPEPVQRHRLAQCTDYPVGQVIALRRGRASRRTIANSSRLVVRRCRPLGRRAASRSCDRDQKLVTDIRARVRR